MRPMIYSVEDDETIRELIACAVDAGGFDVKTFEDAESMLKSFSSSRCDLVLMDIMLPGMDGITAMEKIKAVCPELPVILVSAKGTEPNRVAGLNAGADDYVVKPFGVLELIARIKARLRKPGHVEFGDLTLDEKKREATADGRPIKLTQREFDILCVLIRSGGDVAERERLISELWGADFEGETRTVDMHVKSIRAKLESSKSRVTVETVRGVGYRLRIREDV